MYRLERENLLVGATLVVALGRPQGPPLQLEESRSRGVQNSCTFNSSTFRLLNFSTS